MDKLPDLNRFSNNLPQAREHGSQLGNYYGYAAEAMDDDGLDLKEIWRIISKHRRTIMLFTAIVLMTTLAATLMMRPVFMATAVIEVSPNNRNIVRFQNVDEVDSNPWTYQQTQARIIQSESVAQAVVDRLDLESNPLFTGEQEERGLISGLRQIASQFISPLLAGIRSLLTGNQVSETDSKVANDPLRKSELAPEAQDLAYSVLGGLSVIPVRDSNLFEVSYESYDPVLAAAISNAVVEEYIRLSGERRFQSTGGAKAYLESEIERVQGRLESSEKELNEFARKNQVVDLEDKNNIIATRLQDLNQSLTEVKSERITAESLYRQAQQVNIDTLPTVLENDLIKALKANYTSLRSEYASMSRIYKPKYPKLQQIGSQLADVRASLEQEVANIKTSLQVSYEQLQDKEQLLEQAVDQQKNQLLVLQDRAIQYNILKREWETNKELYSGLLERMKEVGVAAGMELDNVAIIDKAVIPTDPYKPSLRRNMMIALMLGLMGGVGLAFLLAFLDNTVRTSEEVERLVRLPSLGLVPKVNTKTLPAEVSLDLLAHQMREKDLAEAMRSIRTSLMFSTADGLPKTLAVTSSSPAEGKSMTAINLSIVLAQSGASVLLIDADLRAPRLHKVFKFPRGPGLTDYLVKGELHLMEDTGIEHLTLMTSGTSPPNPAELLGSSAMDHLLEGLSEKFDYVLVDSAPVMGLADPIVLSTKVKGVLMVVAAGKISKGALKEAVKRLRSVNAPMTGVVLNQIQPDSSEYGYYSRYYYNYGTEQSRQIAKRAA